MPSASTKPDYNNLPAILWLQNAERYFNYIFPCDQFSCHILWLKSYWNALNRTKTASAILPHHPSSPSPKLVQVVWMEMLLLSKRLCLGSDRRWTVPTGTLHNHWLGFSQSMCISQRKWTEKSESSFEAKWCEWPQSCQYAALLQLRFLNLHYLWISCLPIRGIQILMVLLLKKTEWRFFTRFASWSALKPCQQVKFQLRLCKMVLHPHVLTLNGDSIYNLMAHLVEVMVPDQVSSSFKSPEFLSAVLYVFLSSSTSPCVTFRRLMLLLQSQKEVFNIRC